MKNKCSECAYAVARDEGEYHVCRYPSDSDTVEGIVFPTGNWVPDWCPKPKPPQESNKHRAYESQKKQIAATSSTAQEYERRVTALSRKLGI